MHAKSFGDTAENEFPDENILPVTISFVEGIDYNWKPQETCDREAFKRSEAKKVLKDRNDNQHLSGIYEAALSYFDKQDYKYEFTYINNYKTKFDQVPVTQAMVFLRDPAKEKFVIVRDEGELFFSLPGGGCRMDECGSDCAKREVMEEAQVSVKNPKLLGTVIVDVKKSGVTLSRSQHLRYVGNAGQLKEFIPNKDGFETVERKLVNYSKLKDKVKLLQNKTGDKILQHVKQQL